jgi:hypothetical protein
MAERDVSAGPSESIRPVWGRGFWALAALLVVLAVVTALPRELDPASRASLALARSLALDGDREWGEPDRQRQREERLIRGLEGGAPMPLVVERRGREVPDASLLQALYLAPWSLLGPRGALLGHILLMGAAALVAARALGRTFGTLAPWLVLLFVGGSSLFAYFLRLWAEGFLAALTALAFAVAWRAAHPSEGELAEIYRPPAAGGSEIWRWGLVGLLLGAVAGTRLHTLPLLLGAAALVPQEQRRRGLPWLLAAGILALGATILAEGAGGGMAAGAAGWWEAVSAGLAAAGADPGALGLHSRLEGSLWGWNALYLLVGRHGGALFYLAPAILALAYTASGRGRAGLGGALLLAVVAALWLQPFTLFGAPWSLGPGALVPLFPALWFLLARAPSRWALAALWLWSALFLWPAWLSPLTSPVAEGGQRPWQAPYLSPWAPFETTQAGLRHSREAAAGALRLVPLSASVRPAAGPGRLMFVGDRWAEVLVESPRALAGLNVELGESGASLPEIRGGELGEVMLRPDGGVEVLVRLPRAAAVHSVLGREGRAHFYRLAVLVPDGPRREVSLRIAGIAEGGDPQGR